MPCQATDKMLTLAVDTSTRSGSFALLHDETSLGQEPIPPDAPYSIGFSYALDRLLASLEAKLPQIEVFAVGAGPGSFTGLRVGLTAVKAWSEVFGKPIVAVSGLEAIAAQAVPSLISRGDVLLAPVLDARRGQVFGGVYRCARGALAELKSECPEVVAGAEEFVDLVCRQSSGEAVLFACPTPATIQPALDRSTLSTSAVQAVSGVLAPMIGKLAYFKALRGNFVDALQLDANYVRRTDAELRWKDA
jgi:tRNA threonylcarbamoyladenosine biosynthesis protein TsaB